MPVNPHDYHARGDDPRRALLARCRHCGRPIIINDGHREYGSDACRQAAYRRRRQRVTSDRS
jgi:hypothetical protein